MATSLTSNLVVTAVAEGSVVWYTIHPSRDDKTQLKTIRFSELNEMHGKLSKEVPAFPGRLPPKTLRKNTKPNFIETRRTAIELYLRLASTDEMAQASGAWRKLFGGPAASFDQKAGSHTGQNVSFKVEDGDGSEDQREAWEAPIESFSSTGCEVRLLLQSKKKNLTVAQQRMQSLEGDLETIVCSVLAAEADAKDKAAAEIEAAAGLRTHRESLAELDMQLSVKSMVNKSSERQQSEMANRLFDELQTKLQRATSAKNKAQESVEIACKAVADASTKAHANVAAATAVKAEVEATHADALAVSALQVRAKARLDDVSTAKRELENLKWQQEVFDAEEKDAEDLNQKIDVATKVAVGDVASHIEESASRGRAHNLEIQRLRECSINSDCLRDMRTRGLLMGVDRSSLEPAENASNVAAEAAAEALANAHQAAIESNSSDECQLVALQTVAALATKKLLKRETIVAAFATRSANHKVAIENASTKLAATAFSPNNAIQQLFETCRQQVETCAPALPKSSAVAEATQALVTVTEEHESELHLLRQAEQVETQVLKERQAEEAALVKALREAQRAATQAAVAFEPSVEEGPDFNQLVKSSEARCVDLDKVAQVAAQGHKAAIEAVEVVKRDLAAAVKHNDDNDNANEDDNGDSDIGDGDNGDVSPSKKEREGIKRKIEKEREAAKRKKKVGSLSSKKETLEQAVQDKNNVEKTAAVAANAARKELDALRLQQRTTFCPAEVMVKQEMNLVDSCVASRKDNEAAIVAEVQQKVAALMVEQEELGPDLHRAKLVAAAAEAEVTTNTDLSARLSKGPNSLQADQTDAARSSLATSLPW